MSESTTESGEQMPPKLLRVPGWERFPWLRAGVSTRQGGCSSAYGEAELNLGWTAEDDPRCVAANRSAFSRAVTGGETLPLITVRQVHGTAVRDLEQEGEPWMMPDGKARMEGDGVVSLTPGRLLATLTADCVPVLIADTQSHAVGTLHAGWRGTLGGIVGRGLDTIKQHYGSRPEHLIAAIGPCIQPCCFQVGEEVRAAFLDRDPTTETLFATRQEGTLTLNLQEANRRQLAAAGLREENITGMGLCTACARTPRGERMFFSHRAERGVTGRMLSGIASLSRPH